MNTLGPRVGCWPQKQKQKVKKKVLEKKLVLSIVTTTAIFNAYVAMQNYLGDKITK